jgi:Acetyltransferase (GNAT) family
MIFAILAEAANRGELILVPNGLCRYHKRKDAVVVIHEILVQPWAYRQGIGKEMVRQIIEKHKGCPLLARCPASYAANRFWEALGFKDEGQSKGNNEWWLRDSSSVPTATENTLALPLTQDGNTECDSLPEESAQACGSPLPIKTGDGPIASNT